MTLGPFVFLVCNDKQPRKGLTSPSGIIDSHWLELEIMFHNENRKEYVWHSDDPPGCPLIIPRPL